MLAAVPEMGRSLAIFTEYDGKLTADGWTLDNNTWQGVRTFDASIGQWNTPDAYAGDLHDPMSQQPYMWNSNNPYQYSDPSGFCTARVVEHDCLLVMETSDDPGQWSSAPDGMLAQEVLRPPQLSGRDRP